MSTTYRRSSVHTSMEEGSLGANHGLVYFESCLPTGNCEVGVFSSNEKSVVRGTDAVGRT